MRGRNSIAVVLITTVLQGCNSGLPLDQGGVGAPLPQVQDECPDDPSKLVPGLCGCGVSDSLPDCIDGCPDDPLKTEPGLCGCGIAESDADRDTHPDCIDDCPEDRWKTEPGLCGCGVRDSDSDGDGTPDCLDACPEDNSKTEPGEGGCDLPDDELLVTPFDGAIVLADLTIWSTLSFQTVSTWQAGDRLVHSRDGFFSRLTNSRTSETVGVSWESVGRELTIVSFARTQYTTHVTLDDGIEWSVFSLDENESRLWRIGDRVVLGDYKQATTIAINLRTGRIIRLL